MFFPSPMLARTFSKKRDEPLWTSLSWAASWKHDGWRMLLAHDETGVLAKSRTRKPIPVPAWLEKWVKSLSVAGIMIDCELLGGRTSTDVAHYITSRQDEMRVVVFDLLYSNYNDLTNAKFEVRRARLLELLTQAAPEVRVSVETLAFASNEKHELMKKVEEEGGEGVIFKNMHLPYAAGGRTALVKLKLTEDYDVVICGTDGKSVGPGYVGLEYGWFDVETGEIKKVGSLGYTGPLAELLPWMGKVVKVKGYGLSELGCIRHPHLVESRDDKNPEDCRFNFTEGVEVP